jgi:alkanesulfonate monooxygenase SsuD/methylene tetrahydromethanopterin reductase-like flavin-dependent oxidoreductase (luciferase family)
VTDLAKLLERSRFDAIFLDDVIGLYGDYRGGWDTYVREGLQILSQDPSVLISALAHVTEHLGLAFTSSIILGHPFIDCRERRPREFGFSHEERMAYVPPLHHRTDV